MKMDKNDAAARLEQNDEYTLSAEKEVPSSNNLSAQNMRTLYKLYEAIAIIYLTGDKIFTNSETIL